MGFYSMNDVIQAIIIFWSIERDYYFLGLSSVHIKLIADTIDFYMWKILYWFWVIE